MPSTVGVVNWRSLVRVSIAAPFAIPATAQQPLLVGLDHIPVVVRDLDAAVATFRALGFTVKDGRVHENGIRNAHVKFPDGAGIELVRVTEPRDSTAARYASERRRGEGPVYFSLHARNLAALRATLRSARYAFHEHLGITTLTDPALATLFIVPDNRSPTDRPEHFAHANGARALSAIWIATDTPGPMIQLLQTLGGRLSQRSVQVPHRERVTVVTLASGEVLFFPGHRQLMAGREIIGAAFQVENLDATAIVLRRGGVPFSTAPRQLLVPPSATHGLWVALLGGD